VALHDESIAKLRAPRFSLTMLRPSATKPLRLARSLSAQTFKLPR
jgi:hypothetical protein